MIHSRPVAWGVREVLPRLRFPTWGVPQGLRARGKRNLRTGDILLSVSAIGLSSILTPGFDHAALVLGAEPDAHLSAIGEMTRHGFGVVTWREFCNHSRRVLICRCTDFEEGYIAEMVARCIKVGHVAAYDMQAEQGDKELTCAELVYEADFARLLKIKPWRPWWSLAEVLTPQQLLDAGNVIVVWDSAGKFFGKVK
jgi:hypothetical protein